MIVGLFVCVLIVVVCGTPYVDYFQLVNTNNGEGIQKLRNYDVIALDSGYTIVARLKGSGNVSRVVFVEPFERIDISAPYSLGGDRPGRQFNALSLVSGHHCISAYVNDEVARKKTIQFWISDQVAGKSRIPMVGPLDSAIMPVSAEDELPIPPQRVGCSRMNITVWIDEMHNVEGRDDQVELQVGVDWCTERNDFVRIRLIQYSVVVDADGNRTASTKVLNQVMVEARDVQRGLLERFKVNKICSQKFVYVEACVSGLQGPICSTSTLRYIDVLPARAPRLSMRPPHELKVAPGDKVRIVSRMEDGEGSEGFSNGGFDIVNETVTVFGVHERVDGDVEMTKQEQTKVLDMQIPFNGTQLTLADDNSLVYLKYVSQRCFGNGSLRPLYATRILVNNTFPSLVQQDTQLPTFETPIYPETPHHEPVELAVVAENPGGGFTLDGNRTKLHYQWYVRTEDKREKPTYAEAIPGATNPVLQLERAECHVEICEIGGCSALRLYFVDVCNTYGCRRSAGIVPRVLPPRVLPQGMIWNSTTCFLEPVVDPNFDYGEPSPSPELFE